MPKTVALPLQSNLFSPEISVMRQPQGVWPFALKLGRWFGCLVPKSAMRYFRLPRWGVDERPLSKHYVHSGVRRTVHPG